jgi:Zn-dependent peptidase ImmA (M78 family)
VRVPVRPEMLRWACDRAGYDLHDLAHRIPQLPAWVGGEKQPTLKQLENFAKATHTPVGYLFLAEPPEEPVPIPDFRTVADTRRPRPSPDLLDTVYLCQQRQDWYRDFARSMGDEPLPFVGSSRLGDDVTKAASAIRNALGFDLEARRQMPTWTDALRRFIDQADLRGVLVMVNGVVGSNNRRKLDPQEFRGFALVDPLAPLVFINGADTKAAQMFTLAHELAHIWLGETALSNAEPAGSLDAPTQTVERWCNRVAAELLVPLETFRAERNDRAPLRDELDRLAKQFKVSTLVVLRRMHDAGSLRGDAYWNAYEAEVGRLREVHKGSGGNFYLTLGARASKRFARALVVSTLEGRSSFTEAFRLLGFKKMSTFRELGHSLGMGIEF